MGFMQETPSISDARTMIISLWVRFPLSTATKQGFMGAPGCPVLNFGYPTAHDGTAISSQLSINIGGAILRIASPKDLPDARYCGDPDGKQFLQGTGLGGTGGFNVSYGAFGSRVILFAPDSTGIPDLDEINFNNFIAGLKLIIESSNMTPDAVANLEKQIDDLAASMTNGVGIYSDLGVSCETCAPGGASGNPPAEVQYVWQKSGSWSPFNTGVGHWHHILGVVDLNIPAHVDQSCAGDTLIVSAPKFYFSVDGIDYSSQFVSIGGNKFTEPGAILPSWFVPDKDGVAKARNDGNPVGGDFLVQGIDWKVISTVDAPMKMSSEKFGIPGAEWSKDDIGEIYLYEFSIWLDKTISKNYSIENERKIFYDITSKNGLKYMAPAKLTKAEKDAYDADGITGSARLSKAAAPNNLGKPDMFFSGGAPQFIINRGTKRDPISVTGAPKNFVPIPKKILIGPST